MAERPTAKIIVVKDNRALLGQSQRKNWKFAGGGPEPGDGDWESTAQRELLEEFGLSAQSLRFLFTVTGEFDQSKVGDLRHGLTGAEKKEEHYFLCDEFDGEPTPGDDVRAVEWVSFNDVLGRLSYVTNKEAWEKFLKDH